MQLQFVVKAKIQEASQLRGRLSDIAPNAPSALKFSVEEVCRVVTPTATCRSRLLDTCTECRSRSHLPAAPDVEQVQRLASGNANASLVEIRTGSEEEIAVWQREKEKAMQRQVNRLQEEVLTAASADASLEDVRLQETTISISCSMQSR